MSPHRLAAGGAGQGPAACGAVSSPLRQPEQQHQQGGAAGVGRVLITGGASGLGAAVADEVAKHGGEPVVLDRVPTPGPYEFVLVDLADTARTAHAVAHIAEQGLDAVVTCAGIDVLSARGSGIVRELVITAPEEPSWP